MSLKLKLWLAVSLLLSGLLMTPAKAGVSVFDAGGDKIELKQPAQRIISLAPHITELLYSIGAGKRLIGAVNYSDYPPEALNIPRIGGYNSVDLELILSLKPDLVVGWQSGNNPEQLLQLKRFGVSVFITEPRHLEDIPETMRRLAVLTGTAEQARDAIQGFQEKLAALRTYSQRTPVTVFYQIWDRPLMTVNDEHLISDVIRLCGGRNVFADLTSLAGKISVEGVVARAPEVIVIGGMAEQHPEWIEHWRQWTTIPAVRNEQVYLINPDHLQRHTTRILQGAETLCRYLERARQ